MLAEFSSPFGILRDKAGTVLSRYANAIRVRDAAMVTTSHTVYAKTAELDRIVVFARRRGHVVRASNDELYRELE